MSKSRSRSGQAHSSALSVVERDLLSASEQYIVHQCNCVSKGARGLAKCIFQRWPHADVYGERHEQKSTSKLGSIAARGVYDGQRGVINLFGQYSPGKPKSNGKDSVGGRLTAFRSGLEAISQLPGLESVALPHDIGCGLAGGSWDEYHKAILEFSERLAPFAIKVTLYKLPNARFNPYTKVYDSLSLKRATVVSGDEKRQSKIRKKQIDD